VTTIPVEPLVLLALAIFAALMGPGSFLHVH
jgi:hypothetical protein